MTPNYCARVSVHYSMKHSPSYYGLPEELNRASTIAHPDTISHLLPLSTPGMFVLCSIDGFMHYFSLKDDQFESLKIFKLHSAPFTDLYCCKRFLVSVSLDRTAKWFLTGSTGSLEIVRVVSFEEIPEAVCIVDDPMVSADVWLVVSFRDSTDLNFYKLSSQSDCPEFVIDTKEWTFLKLCFNSNLKRLFAFSEPNLLVFDIETILKEQRLIPIKSHIVGCDSIGSLCLSNDQQQIAFTASDHSVRLLNADTLKPVKRFDESNSFYQRLVESGKMERSVFDQKWRVEEELYKSPYASCQRLCFDHDDRAILYPSMLGIKAVDLETNKVIAIYGKSIEFRPVAVILHQINPDKMMSVELAASDNPKARFDCAMVLLCTMFRQPRLMIYNDAMMDSVHANSTIFPTIQGSTTDIVDQPEQYIPGHKAIMRTTLGDITIELFPQQTPLTVQNFCTLSRRHYYDNLLFHRVIRGFMIQTGCPRGDGTGGESMWGGYFRNELSADLKHDRPFTVSMANSGGARSNGSQFFITTIRAPWLDRKNTVFGRVVAGEDVVRQIEQVETDRLDRPKQDVKVITIEIQ